MDDAHYVDLVRFVGSALPGVIKQYTDDSPCPKVIVTVLLSNLFACDVLINYIAAYAEDYRGVALDCRYCLHEPSDPHSTTVRWCGSADGPVTIRPIPCSCMCRGLGVTEINVIALQTWNEPSVFEIVLPMVMIAPVNVTLCARQDGEGGFVLDPWTN